MGQPTLMETQQLRTLERLKSVAALADFYLAGEGAVAAHLRHRGSREVHLFSKQPGVDLEVVRRALTESLGEVQVIGMTDVALGVRVGTVPVELVRYSYPLSEPAVPGPAGWETAGLADLGAMKLAAIARRGLRRDFWDLHAILGAGPTLQSLAAVYVRRFGMAESDLYSVARGLTYFVDAEREPAMPDGMTLELWRNIKVFFTRRAAALLDVAQ